MINNEPSPAGFTAEIPCTGWDGNGGVRPFAGVMNAPDAGPGANVSAGSTARASSTDPPESADAPTVIVAAETSAAASTSLFIGCPPLVEGRLSGDPRTGGHVHGFAAGDPAVTIWLYCFLWPTARWSWALVISERPSIPICFASL